MAASVNLLAASVKLLAASVNFVRVFVRVLSGHKKAPLHGGALVYPIQRIT